MYQARADTIAFLAMMQYTNYPRNLESGTCEVVPERAEICFATAELVHG